MKALLLGAGASYDCGFPLVTELTPLFKSKAMKLLDKYPHHCNNQKICLIIQNLFNTSMHYEAIVGYLEVLFNQTTDSSYKKDLYYTIGFFYQIIHYTLLENYQIPQSEYCLKTLEAFRGIKHLLSDNHPLWIFSLNHDIIVEMLSNLLNINLKSGFFDAKPISFNSYQNKYTLLFEELTRCNINHNQFNFFRHNESGINLLKMHGSLDIFAYGDDTNYRKIKFEKNDPESGTKILKLIAEVNFEIVNKDKINCVNESVFFDEYGEIQFLRHSILSGAHKFSPKMQQIAPPEFLAQFKSNLNYIDELVCIGYGFGDQHINEIIEEWLSFNDDNKLIIVNPYGEVPSFLIYLIPKISIIKKRTTDYFMSISEMYDDSSIKSVRPIIDVMNKSRDSAKRSY